MAIDDVGVLEGHDVAVAQSSEHADFAEDGLVIALAGLADKGDFDGNPNTFDGISGFPDLTISALAQLLDQTIFA